MRIPKNFPLKKKKGKGRRNEREYPFYGMPY